MFGILLTCLFCFSSSIVEPINFDVMSQGASSTDGGLPSTESNNSNEVMDSYSYFSGNAINVQLYEQKTGTWSYPYIVYYRYISSYRGYVSFNYSGPETKITIYYSNFFSANDYLTCVQNFGGNSSVDCYYFDNNIEYIIELQMTNSNGLFNYSFCMEIIDYTLPNAENYVLHMYTDPSPSGSFFTFHYRVEYVLGYSGGYSPIESNIISNSASTSYLNLIDSTHNFNVSNDNRRMVSNTAYREYSSICYMNSSYYCQMYDDDLGDNAFVDFETNRFSGTFISENAILTSAHCIYSSTIGSMEEYNSLPIGVNAYPGINTYSSFSDYGDYSATEIFVSVSFILKFNIYNSYNMYSPTSDWAIVICSPISSTLPSHSYMGVSSFSGTTSLAISVGYPKLQNCPSVDVNLFGRTLWASYPLEGSASVHTYLNGMKCIYSSYHITTGGNSGGPLYLKYVYIENGQTHYDSQIIGICSGYILNNYAFFQMTTNIVNIIKEIIDYV